MRIRYLAILASASTLIHCTSGLERLGEPSKRAENDEASASPTHIVLEDHGCVASVEQAENSLTASISPNCSTQQRPVVDHGTIVAGLQPPGYLRRAQGTRWVSDRELVIDTKTLSIVDLQREFQQAESPLRVSIPPDAWTLVSADRRARPECEETLIESVEVTAVINEIGFALEPSFELDVEFDSQLRPEQASVALAVDADGILDGSIGTAGAVAAEWECLGASFRYWAIIYVGPVPVPFLLDVDVIGSAGVEAELPITVAAGFEGDASTGPLGLTWNADDGWSPEPISPYLRVGLVGPTLDASPNASAWLGVEVDAAVLVAGLVGPTGAIRNDLRLDADLIEPELLETTLTLTGDAEVGIELSVFGLEEIASVVHHFDLYDEELLTEQIDLGSPEIDFDGDGSEAGEDCDDFDPNVYPGAPELCDGIDNDCDGAVDEGVQEYTWYEDVDSDGFGGQAAVHDCAQPPGWVLTPGDCDDEDASRYPGAPEACDWVDSDCDGSIVDEFSNYDDDAEPDCVDADDDNDGDPDASDCADYDDHIHNGAEEVCDGVDNDCDGAVDEVCSETILLYPLQDCTVTFGVGMFDDQAGINRDHSSLEVGYDIWDADNWMRDGFLVDFDIKGNMPPGATLVSAVLYLDVTAVDAPAEVWYGQVIGAWDEATVTYDTLPDYHNVGFVFDSPASVGPMDLSVTSYVSRVLSESWHPIDHGMYFRLYSYDVPAVSNGAAFYHDESGRGPMLEITYLP